MFHFANNKPWFIYVINLLLISTLLFSTTGWVSAQTDPQPEETPTDPTQPPVEVTDPVATDPVPTDPVPTEPPATETPVPTDPVPTDVVPTEMIPTEAPVEETDAPEVVPLIISESADIIEGQYIIVYKEDMKDNQVVNEAALAVRESGGRVNATFDRAFKGFSATLNPGMLKKLRQDPRIAYIEADQVISVDEGDEIYPQDVRTSANWGLDRIDQVNLPLNGKYRSPNDAGDGVDVYIIDTGIRATHDHFDGRVVMDYNYWGGSPTDCKGHGTHVAGIVGSSVFGVANEVTLHAVKVLDCSGNGTDSSVIGGINWVIAHHTHPAVINMSLGGDVSQALDDAVNAAIAHGITVVVAAGNENEDACEYSPGRVPNAITVAATTRDDQRSRFSNFGSCVDIFAPGSAILSDYYLSDTSITTMSGTSMASPFVAGAAALYLSYHPEASPAEVTAALIERSSKDVVNGLSGSPNRLLYAPVQIPAQISLVSPANSSLFTTRTLDLAWNATTWTLEYEVQIDKDSTFATPDVQIVDLEVTSTTTSVPADGKYYWRVRALNDYDDPSPWSAYRAFTVDTIAPAVPKLSTPANGSQPVGTPSFVWLAAATASRYQFAYGTDPDANTNPGTLVYQSGELSTLNHKPPAMTLMTPYYWFVRAKDAAGNWSAWSAGRAVMSVPAKPVAPGLLSPAANLSTNDATPALSWKAVTYGYRYEVQIDKSYTFTIPLDQEILDIDGLSVDSPELTSNGKYYWRVRAVNQNNVKGPWSAYRAFTVDTVAPAAPVLSAPANNTTPSGTPTFSWKAPASAVRYIFAYGIDPDPVTNPGTVVYESAELSVLTHKPPTIEILPEGLTYYWFVKARDAAGNWSGWSTPNAFINTLPVPGVPALTGPAANVLTSYNTVMLTWNGVPYAASYDLQIDKSYTFTAPLDGEFSAIDSNNQTTDALPDGKYYWRVRAINGTGTGKWSAYRAFTVDTIAPAVPKLSTPANGSQPVGTPSFVWLAAATASRYQFAYGTDPDANTNPGTLVYQSGELSTLNHKPPAMTLMTPYYWFVRAKDAAGNWSAWSAGRAVMSVPAKPVAPGLLSPAANLSTNDATPALSWKAVTNGYRYEVQIDKSYTFTIPLDQEILDIDGLGVDASTLADGKYYWRVRAVNQNNVKGAWSAYRAFTIDTVAPAEPLLSSPADTGQVISPKPGLTIKAVTGAARYHFQISTENTFASPIRDVTQTALTFTTTESLNYDTTYYWRASAIDAAGNVSGWSGTRSFIFYPIRNGDFEEGASGWTQYSSHGYPSVFNFLDIYEYLGLMPPSGIYAVWLGGVYNDTSRVTQSGFSVGGGARYLHYWYFIASNDVCGRDFAKVVVNGVIVQKFNLCAETSMSGWYEDMIDLSSFTNKPITLQFVVTTNGSNNSHFFLDNISINSSTSIAGMQLINSQVDFSTNNSEIIIEKEEVIPQE